MTPIHSEDLWVVRATAPHLDENGQIIEYEEFYETQAGRDEAEKALRRLYPTWIVETAHFRLHPEE